MRKGDDMDDDLRWAVGVAITIFVAFAGLVVAAFRNMSAKITKTHERIDDVKDKYVRRDDLDQHLKRIDTTVKELRTEIRENHRQVIAALSSDKD